MPLKAIMAKPNRPFENVWLTLKSEIILPLIK